MQIDANAATAFSGGDITGNAAEDKGRRRTCGDDGRGTSGSPPIEMGQVEFCHMPL